ncbi:MAG: leucine--tRNA ligase, partial [Candidatus Aenigmarchaeota archaeon]|nr:leucine--tRNA ligase [Candidatus Aenigmarchaeota archaeon]
EETRKMTELERISEEKEKKGVFTGRYLINPITKEKIPIWIANYVIMSYGTGVVMGVPTQDQRDFEFAKKYGMELKNVINPPGKEINEGEMKRAYTDPGVITNSEQFNGMDSEEAKEKMSEFFIKKGVAEKAINYKIRDWNISRQRYWGTPIPIVYCEKCGIVPLSEEDLPLELPMDVNFKAKVISPLATNEDFYKTKCPKCGGPAKRETDTMTTFVDSAWYFLKYPDPKNTKEIFDKDIINYWLPADQYIGGTEHAVGHLMYSRFITKFLNDLGLLKFDEPFLRLLNQGMVLKDGTKMSKSKGNTIDPREIVDKHGVDVLRTYLMSMAAPDKDVEWSDRDLKGIEKFLEKVIEIFGNLGQSHKKQEYIQSITQKAIINVTKYMRNLEQNKALLELTTLTNEMVKYPDKKSYKILLMMLTPFAPHTCEELWEMIGEKPFISTQEWPKPDKKLINEKVEKQEESIRNSIRDVKNILELVEKKPKKIYLYVIPPELEYYKNSTELFKKDFKQEVIIQSSANPEYDPENKAKRTKFGKPGIYVE